MNDREKLRRRLTPWFADLNTDRPLPFLSMAAPHLISGPTNKSPLPTQLARKLRGIVFTLPNQHYSKGDTTFRFQARHCKHLRAPALPCLLFPLSMGFKIRRVLQLATNIIRVYHTGAWSQTASGREQQVPWGKGYGCRYRGQHPLGSHSNLVHGAIIQPHALVTQS